jgi:tyrosyl-tRNA synthetase
LHPRNAKMQLAFEVTSAFYSEDDARKAEKDFVQKFQKKVIPEELDDFIISKNSVCLEVLVDSRLVSSRSEARRMVEQRAVKLDGTTITDWNALIKPGVLQVGKRKFLRLKWKKT